MFSAETKRKWARFIGLHVHDLHRIRIPLTRRMLLPLNVKALESHLRDIHDVFGRHGITFWLRDGTALGVYRDGGIIPTDDDIDLGMWASDLPKMDAALDELYRMGFKLCDRFPHLIALLKDWETVELVVSGVAGQHEAEDSYIEYMERAFFTKLAQVEFLGRTFNLPGDTDRYMEFSYGADWRIPKLYAYWSNTNWLPKKERDAHVSGFAGRNEG